jgi:hypothetical protein
VVLLLLFSSFLLVQLEPVLLSSFQAQLELVVLPLWV